MQPLEWSVIYYITIIFATCFAGLIAVAKLFFITNKTFETFKNDLNKKFYDSRSTPYFMTKEDCMNVRSCCEKQRDKKHDLSILQISKLQNTTDNIKNEQTKMVIAINKLTLKFEQIKK